MKFLCSEMGCCENIKPNSGNDGQEPEEDQLQMVSAPLDQDNEDEENNYSQSKLR